MAKEIKIKGIATYNGHSLKNNKAVDLGMVFKYDELPNYIRLIQLLNENISIAVRIKEEDPIQLGTFMIKEIKVDHDGMGFIKFNSQLDSVNADEINKLVGEMFKVMFKAAVEVEDVGDED